MILIREIGGPAELITAQQLRANVYRHEGLEIPDNFVEGRMVDPDDGRALHLAAFDLNCEEMVGTFKFTIRQPRHPMRVEKYWDKKTLRLPKRLATVQVAELARLAVLPTHRSLGIHLGLWQSVFRSAVRAGVQYAYAMQREGSLINQEKMGLPVERLGSPVEVRGFQYTPTVINVATVLASLVEVQPALAYYFSQDVPSGIFDGHSVLTPPPSALSDFVGGFRSLRVVPAIA
jgi:hypothetical protein